MPDEKTLTNCDAYLRERDEVSIQEEYRLLGRTRRVLDEVDRFVHSEQMIVKQEHHPYGWKVSQFV